MQVGLILEGPNKGKWVAQDPVSGWIGSEGQPIVVQASQRHTKFFKTVAEAKINGFSPSSAQLAAIAKWSPEIKPAAKESPKSAEAPDLSTPPFKK